MKKLANLSLIITLILSAFTASAQTEKSKRPSPPDTVRATIKKGIAIEVAYSQPSVKGRTVGTDIAPYGKVWRTGANEVTTIQFDKDVKIDGKALAAGKYGLYSIPGESEWVVIFSKGNSGWGTNYKQEDDALRVTVKTQKAASFTEKLTFKIDPAGKVSFAWGDKMAAFTVK
ncbi:DUF2911 domain-containing protein [Mucilaginibacter sp. Bleaf8]|uniref:DUF2911 domain-containing protein n=1 Tax=Mucilaginibacter sp. Bleaf8 TaxID=2834430 RepID=UPI001BCC9FBE|nr:DUF2911 domain-containing protein [Mucilaginibacter sp. Bleaf8]MBS7564004.1 DUF2911 domain-containing protein [Mucilaginibacter sp. Bleaf8]